MHELTIKETLSVLKKYPIVPGRMLNTPSATAERIAFLQDEGYHIKDISDFNIAFNSIQNKIESFVGTVEMPLGLVGPLLFNENNTSSYVFCLGGTLEGALIASMNRGAKAISRSGGFDASVIHQKMVRSPLFILSSIEEAEKFKQWIVIQYDSVKRIAEKHSNHARLLYIDTVVTGSNVHVNFYYSTGDASGQNMTTTCTWHAVLWVVKAFEKECKIRIEDFVIEGNSSSDKKVSYAAIEKGRGIHVIAKCHLKEKEIQKVFRTTSEKMLKFFHASKTMASINRMVGYNINAANAIAAIFLATGQDLASIHESSVAILSIEKANEGLNISLTLPNLVAGTVGGGTNLPAQQEALQLMGCAGNGKVQRFAKLIAGFTLALEMSTLAAIVSGGFAKAHESLGRNKPVKWLTRSEISTDLVRRCLIKEVASINELTITIGKEYDAENSIINTIANRVNNKPIGFFPATLHYPYNNKLVNQNIILKSKPLDHEVIKGFHIIAASIDPELSDLLWKYKNHIEYHNCHLKETAIYEQLYDAGFSCTPKYFGKRIDVDREIYILLLEWLNTEEVVHIDSQERPGLWTNQQIKQVIKEISNVHNYFLINPAPYPVIPFNPHEAIPLYDKFLSVMMTETLSEKKKLRLRKLKEQLLLLTKEGHNNISIPKTLIHNDLNPRNIAIRTNGKPAIYDWELAMIDFPHRDIIELLSFVLPEKFLPEQLFDLLDYHYEVAAKNSKVSEKEWFQGYLYSTALYIATRLSFYDVAGIHAEYPFTERVFNTTLQIEEMIKKKYVSL